MLVEGLDNLFFVLSSESRLDILYAVRDEKLRMNELARKIDITATEASRQIQRMLEESLLQKHPDGTYSLTNYGLLVIHIMPFFHLIYRYKKYFLEYDVWQLPDEFISRLGDLSEGVLYEEIAKTVNRIESMMRSSEDYVYVITDQVMNVHGKAMDEQLLKGVKFRSIVHEKLLESPQVPVFSGDVETRTLPSIPGLLVLTEKEAFFSILTTDGRISHSGFYGTDPSLMNWVKDLFNYYWKISKIIPS